MASESIAKEIGALVDHLRAGDDRKISLTDVAAATEVLLQATQMYFRNIDTSIFRQVQKMSDLISAMRRDIAQLHPEDLKAEKIPRAELELDAIVQNSEAATNTIMEAAEELMSLDLSKTNAATDSINDACMRIFEACSFQDITGQRVGKVVKTLTHIEGRLVFMRSDWAQELGVKDFEDIAPVDEADSRPGADLLHGPSLHGEGQNQIGVDALMNGEEKLEVPTTDDEANEKPAELDALPASADLTSPEEAVPTPEQAEQPAEPVSEPEIEVIVPKPEPEVASETAVKENASSPTIDEDEDEGNSQADIDALFD